MKLHFIQINQSPVSSYTYTSFLNTLFRRPSLCILLHQIEWRISVHIQRKWYNYFSVCFNLYFSE